MLSLILLIVLTIYFIYLFVKLLSEIKKDFNEKEIKVVFTSFCFVFLLENIIEGVLEIFKQIDGLIN